MKLILLCVLAERAVLGIPKTALKAKYEIQKQSKKTKKIIFLPVFALTSDSLTTI
jgi:hypothetical protein